MASNHDSGAKSRLSGMVPTNHKEAMFLLSKQRSQDRRESVPVAEVLRDFVEEGLQRRARDGELPEEARDLLDDDLIANAGGDGVTVEVEEVQDA